MKVLTLHQPWASLVALGVKTIETRSWPTSYRGPLAIHAAMRNPQRPDWRVGEYSVRGVGSYVGGAWVLEGPGLPAYRSTPRLDGYLLPLGAIVATCTLVDVVPIVDVVQAEHEAGGFVEVGRTHNYLSLWRPGAEVARRVDDQRPYGDFTPGRYAWLLADIKPVDPPVPFGGGQGLTKTWESEAA